MHTTSNPLFVGLHSSKCPSPAQAAAQASRDKPQLDKIDIESFSRSRDDCCCCRIVLRAWVPVLCAMLGAAALVVWHVHTDRVVAAVWQLLARIETPQHLLDQSAHLIFILKVTLVAVVSSVVGLLLVLGLARAQQLRRKNRALTRGDWPHGCSALSFMGLTASLLVILWLVSVVVVCLLCVAFTISTVAAAANVAVGASVSQLQANPVTEPPAAGTCPTACINLTPLAGLLAPGEHAKETCMCNVAALQELRQQLRWIWSDSMAACVALATLLAVASWLTMHGVASLNDARRDNQEAVLFKRDNAAEARDTRIRNWMRTSPSPGEAFERLDVHADQQRQTQLMAPELRSSMSPNKARKDEWSAALARVADVEQPPLLQDQLLSATPCSGSLACDLPYDTLHSAAPSTAQRSRRRWNDSLTRR